MNRDWIATAQTLSQALPYLQRYADATVVIKLGGHAMGSDEAMEEFGAGTLCCSLETPLDSSFSNSTGSCSGGRGEEACSGERGREAGCS